MVYNVIKYKKGSKDDSIDSAENDDEGVELYRQLKALWGVANMQARRWIFIPLKLLRLNTSKNQRNRFHGQKIDFAHILLV